MTKRAMLLTATSLAVAGLVGCGGSGKHLDAQAKIVADRFTRSLWVNRDITAAEVNSDSPVADDLPRQADFSRRLGKVKIVNRGRILRHCAPLLASLRATRGPDCIEYRLQGLKPEGMSGSRPEYQLAHVVLHVFLDHEGGTWKVTSTEESFGYETVFSNSPNLR